MSQISFSFSSYFPSLFSTVFITMSTYYLNLYSIKYRINSGCDGLCVCSGWVGGCRGVVECRGVSASSVSVYKHFEYGKSKSKCSVLIFFFTGDSLSGHRNQAFTTRDKDHDTNDGGSCALSYKGAWWYTKCHSSNLNGLYLGGHHELYAKGVTWNAWRGYYYSLKNTEMKIRRLP